MSLSPTLQKHANKKELPNKEELAIALSQGELAINFEEML